MAAALYFEIYSLFNTVLIAFLFFVCFCVRILHFLELLPSYSFFFQTSGILQLLESRPSQSLLSWAPFLEKGPPPLKLEKSTHWALIGQFLE